MQEFVTCENGIQSRIIQCGFEVWLQLRKLGWQLPIACARKGKQSGPNRQLVLGEFSQIAESFANVGVRIELGFLGGA